MLPVYSPESHSLYQDFLISNFLLYYPDPFSISRQTWKVIVQFWHLDLSQTTNILLDSYSKFGPAPRDPVSMLRSYLLSIKLKITSITDWVSRLKECPLYAIISGFSPDDVPGIGTFYDFFRHIWNSEQKHLSVQLRHKKKKTPKGKKHGEKTPNIKSTSAARFLDFYKKHPLPDPSFSPLSLIFRLYKQQFLDVSVSHGLIQPSAISLAGDGSPIRTSARLRYKKVCSCSENGISHCNCKRLFSQPDCNIGWDSSRDCYFSGYHLYMFVASDSANDLPVFPILERASRHDMLSFLHTFFTMKTWLPQYRVTKLLLDAAHDADAVYRYCQESGIQPFIDLNSGNTGNFIYKDTFTINNDGVPVCKLGLHMKPDGVERNRNRCKWRCPKANRSGCHCETPCSDSSYGRVVHTPVKDNPRLFNIPPRNSLEWDKEYDRRTSVERSNKRKKEDYKLEDGRHRSSMMWYCRLYCTMMLQHLDAWEMPSIEAFQSLLSLDA